MKFYNRKAELKELKILDSRSPSFLVMTGKRRVGKTRLLTHFSKSSGLYFFVDDKKNELLLVQEYMEIVKSKYQIPLFAEKIESIEQFISLIFNLSKSGHFTVVFDEFQRFTRINPSILNQMQKIWDLEGKKTKIFLIVSGSSVGMMKKIFVEEGAPLFKRADNIISLPALNMSTVFELLNDLGVEKFEEKIKLYLLFGGVPYYYEMLEKYQLRNFEEAVDVLLLKDFAPLRNEIQEILIEEFGRAHSTYYEILNALALGRNTKKEMADYVHIEETSLSPYLKDLIELIDVVAYIIPTTEQPLKSKKGRYRISDNFFYFWFMFIFKNKSLYEQKKFLEIKKFIESEKNNFLGKRFEFLCKEILSKNQIFEFDRLSNWWGHYRDEEGKRKEVEIDLVALNEKSKKILFAECKWREKVDAKKLLSELKEKTKYVSWLNEERKEHFAIFAKSFKEKIKETDVYLFDLKDIENLIKT